MFAEKLFKIVRVNLSVISRMRFFRAHPVSNGMNLVRDNQQMICKISFNFCSKKSFAIKTAITTAQGGLSLVG